MARKVNTVQKQIAQEFRAWLHKHPDASPARRVRAFDKIADKHHQRTKVAA